MPKVASTAALGAALDSLVSDVVAAWGAVRIYTSAPEVEPPDGADATKLPVAFLSTAEDARFDSEAQGAGSIGPRMQVTIVGRFAKPEGGALFALKAGKIDALLARITAQPGQYAGCVWLPDELTFSLAPGGSDAARGYYEVSVGVTLHG